MLPSSLRFPGKQARRVQRPLQTRSQASSSWVGTPRSLPSRITIFSVFTLARRPPRSPGVAVGKVGLLPYRVGSSFFPLAGLRGSFLSSLGPFALVTWGTRLPGKGLARPWEPVLATLLAQSGQNPPVCPHPQPRRQGTESSVGQGCRQCLLFLSKEAETHPGERTSSFCFRWGSKTKMFWPPRLTKQWSPGLSQHKDPTWHFLFSSDFCASSLGAGAFGDGSILLKFKALP